MKIVRDWRHIWGVQPFDRHALNIVRSLLIVFLLSFWRMIGLKPSVPGALSSPNLFTAL